MGVDEDRRALPPGGEQDVADLAPPHRVHPVGRLVEEEDVGLVEERAGEPEALRHPLRVTANPVAPAAGEPHEVEQLGDPPIQVPLGDAGEAAEQAQRRLAGQVAGEAMAFGEVADAPARGRAARVAAAHAHLAARRPGQAEENLDQRGLAGAVGAEKAERLAAPDLEADAFEGAQAPPAVAELLDEPGDGDRG